MPAGRQSTSVTQSHDPDRRLSSHVVQARTKATVEKQRKVGFGAARGKTRAELQEELRRAVENTRGD